LKNSVREDENDGLNGDEVGTVLKMEEQELVF
jgi:hypothetical protein